MDAGRELDKEIAEKIMGLKFSDVEYHEGHAAMGLSKENVWSMKNPPVPHYSTHISDAWMVVEKIKFMQPNWQEFGLEANHHQMFKIDFTGFGWRAGWAPINLDGVMTIEVESETAPHAICLAALKAIE